MRLIEHFDFHRRKGDPHIAVLPYVTVELCNEDTIVWFGFWDWHGDFYFKPPRAVYDVLKRVLYGKPRPPGEASHGQ